MCIIVGGDWNCTTDFTIDRNDEEPYNQSSLVLSKIMNKNELVDVWRIRNLTQWWEVGKAQIRLFCQNYTLNSSSQIK